LSFNHESPFRNELFVTQKIARAAAIRLLAYESDHETESLKLGNLEAVRDWGHARDYCDAYFKMMTGNWTGLRKYIVATG
jgi:GDPmannose 4,6-dehydratase